MENQKDEKDFVIKLFKKLDTKSKRTYFFLQFAYKLK